MGPVAVKRNPKRRGVQVAITVACLHHPGAKRYQRIASAMYAGVLKHGDVPKMVLHNAPANADVAVMYGWKLNASVRKYPQFIYADLGFWQRETHYRMTVGAWGPEAYVRAGLPSDRLESFGVQVKPWNQGEEVLLIGATQKSSVQHGYQYMQWEREMAQRLIGLGHSVAYRPKPNDRMKASVAGCRYDLGPLSESFARAKAVVSHHSNVCVEALAAGVPVHCVTGAAAALSLPIERIGERPEGRHTFLADVAWLQWSLEEMRRGDYWAHIKERGLVC